MLEHVDTQWPQMADRLQEIEKVSEEGEASERQLASMVVSKVYYHLEEYNEALAFALESGELFHIHHTDKYT